MDLADVWSAVRDEVKDRVTGRSMWQAIDAMTPILRDGDATVFGVPHQNADLIGHLRTPATKNMIESLLSEALGSRVVLVVVEGVTKADYEYHQERQREAKRIEEEAHERRGQTRETQQNWEGVFETVGRRFAELPNRSLNQSKALYLQEMTIVIREAIQKVGIDNEMDERQLNRAIERIATNIEAPASIVAWIVLHSPIESA